MDYLPQNPAILVSSINMLLRDEEFDSLESLFNNFNTEPEKIKAILYEAGYVYSEEQEQFRPIGYDKNWHHQYVQPLAAELFEGEYRAIREQIETDPTLTAVVRSRQLQIYRDGKKILVLAGKSAPKIIREDKLNHLLW